jgi:hypothetical protein
MVPQRKQLLITAFTFTIVAFAIRYVILRTPKTIYRFQGRSIAQRCSSIQRGMQRSDVLQRLNTGVVPWEQEIDAHRLTAGTAAGTCFVDLDQNGTAIAIRVGPPLWE